jgi:hypothetical protein
MDIRASYAPADLKSGQLLLNRSPVRAAATRAPPSHCSARKVEVHSLVLGAPRLKVDELSQSGPIHSGSDTRDLRAARSISRASSGSPKITLLLASEPLSVLVEEMHRGLTTNSGSPASNRLENNNRRPRPFGQLTLGRFRLRRQLVEIGRVIIIADPKSVLRARQRMRGEFFQRSK